MRSILVTGASGKIGRKVAEHFMRKGYYGILQCRNNCEVLEALINEAGEGCVIKHDFLREDVKSFIKKVTDCVSTLQAAVISQPLFDQTKPEELTEEKMNEVIRLNLTVPLTLIAELPKIMAEGSTMVVLSELTPTRGISVYSTLRPSLSQVASSAGVQVAVRNFPAYLGTRVKIVGVAMGWMDVPTLRAKDLEAIATDVPAGRPGKIEELLSLLTYLIEESPDYLTGAIIELTGGL